MMLRAERKSVVASFCLLLALPLFMLHAAAQAESPHIAAADARIVVTLKLPDTPRFAPAPSGRMSYSPPNPERIRHAAQTQAQLLADEFDLVIEQQWPIHALNVNCVVYRLPDPERAGQRQAIMRELANRPVVDAVQAMNHFVGRVSQSSGNTIVQETTGAAMTNAATGKGVVIAVVDTGADLAHEVFARAAVESRDLVTNEPSATLPPEQHGTAILGLLLANSSNGPGIRGLAPDAQILLFRACWESDRPAAVCNTFTLAKALAAVLESSADIVNLSISGPADPLLERLGKLLVDDGKLLVAAGESRRGFPGSVPGSVLAAEWPGSGESALTSLPGNRYGMKSGSSIDAVRLTAAFAQLKESNTSLAADSLVQRIMNPAAVSVRSSTSQP